MSIKEDSIHIVIPEGGTKNYIQGFKETLGGVEKENSLIIEKGPVTLQLSYYTIEGVEFTYVELATREPLVITRTPDHNPDFIHINIVTEARFTRRYQEEIRDVESDSHGNVFLYNAMFPSEGYFPADTKLKYLGYKIDLQKLGPLYDGLGEVFSGLFHEDEGLAYYGGLSLENHRLITDIFAFGKLPYGAVPLVSARALEILTNVVLHFKGEVDKNGLAGLHLDDYNTLIAVKEKILSNLERSFTIDELSKEFGQSQSKLKQDFKHLFNTSIYRFYNHARMDEAYRRLKSGEFTVSNVAYDLGYSSLSKFSSMFKKVKGILPTEVLKMK